MRRIPAAGVKWTMGMSSTDFAVCGYSTYNMQQHYVMLTNDYYMAVFELTIGQVRKFASIEWVKGYINSVYVMDSLNKQVKADQHYLKFDNGDTNNCPVGEMKHTFLRTPSTSSVSNWPSARHWVDPLSWLGRLVRKRAWTSICRRRRSGSSPAAPERER